MYWLLLPLTLSAGLSVYLYVTDPDERFNCLAALLSFLTTCNAAAALILSTTVVERLAWWAGLLQALLTFSVSAVVPWLFSLHLVWRRTDGPSWTRWYTAVAILTCAVCAAVTVSDYLQQSSIFYGPLESLALGGYAQMPGQWAMALHLSRLVPLWGALGILLGSFFKAARRWQAALIPLLLFLLATPAIAPLISWLGGQAFPGKDLIADFFLVLASGYINYRLFAPVKTIMYRAAEEKTDGVVTLDPVGQVLQMNRAAERLLDVDERAALNRPFWALFGAWKNEESNESLSEILGSQFQTAPAQNLSLKLTIERAGQHRHTSLYINPLHNHRGRLSGHIAFLADITQSRQREQDMARALAEQNELAAMTTKLSSPILPVMEHTIVLPLVGNLDTIRMRSISDVLLSGIKSHHAQVSILDLTGTNDISNDAALVLLETADATQLLGAKLVLVGVQPQVAEVLGSLDFNLGSLSVYSDLRAGLEYAAQTINKPGRLT